MSVSGISFERGILVNTVYVLPKEEPHHDPGFMKPMGAVWDFSPITHYTVSVDYLVQLLAQTWNLKTAHMEFVSTDLKRVI